MGSHSINPGSVGTTSLVKVPLLLQHSIVWLNLWNSIDMLRRPLVRSGDQMAICILAALLALHPRRIEDNRFKRFIMERWRSSSKGNGDVAAAGVAA